MVAASAPEPASWTDADEARLLELLQAEYATETLEEYIRRKSPRLPPQRHMMPIIEALEEARLARSNPDAAVRIILIELPPRHGKTVTVMHALEHALVTSPALTCAYLTYGDSLAESKSRLMRAHVEADVPLAADMANLSEWRTIHGGGLLAGGIMGPLTGKGITGICVIDDAIKNRQEAESETTRDTVWDQFTDVAYTRLEGPATVVVMATRWHPDDLIGRILAKQDELREELGDQIKIVRIRLPALAESDDPLGRAPGEALWPARFNERRLAAIAAILGDHSFSALYQQNPRFRGSVLFSPTPARFQLYQTLPDGMPDVGRLLWQPRGHAMIICCDPAASKKTKADYSAAFVLAARADASTVERLMETIEFWVVDGFSRHLSIPELAHSLRQLSRRWYDLPIAVEAVGAFIAVPDTLHEIDPTLPVLPHTPLGDKWMRAQPAAALWNRGKFHVPLDAAWAKSLIARLHNFTGADGGKDDETDAISTGVNVLMEHFFQGRSPFDAVVDHTRPFG